MFQINQIINVTSFYFANGRTLKIYPRQIEFGNTCLTFTDGIQYVISQGKLAYKLFDMTDGQIVYRLKQEGNNWSLMSRR